MDIQTRKLNLIAFLSQLKDEKLIESIERFILKDQKNKSENYEPFTQEELINRIKKSEEDFKEGKVKTQKELEKISKNW